jgi:hypothetical protein
MVTPFDILTVACFAGLVLAFFLWTEREPRTLIHFLLCGVAFAVANQVGNAGSTLLAIALVVAGLGYSALVIRGQKRT